MNTAKNEINPALDKLVANGRFLENVAKKLGVEANIGLVYGEPVEREGLTVIPVARITYGFGGGESHETAKEPGGLGGGVGIMANPVGYIEIKDGQARFKPIVDVVSMVRTVLTFVAIIILIGSSVQKSRARLAAKAGRAKLPED